MKLKALAFSALFTLGSLLGMGGVHASDRYFEGPYNFELNLFSEPPPAPNSVYQPFATPSSADPNYLGTLTISATARIWEASDTQGFLIFPSAASFSTTAGTSPVNLADLIFKTHDNTSSNAIVFYFPSPFAPGTTYYNPLAKFDFTLGANSYSIFLPVNHGSTLQSLQNPVGTLNGSSNVYGFALVTPPSAVAVPEIDGKMLPQVALLLGSLYLLFVFGRRNAGRAELSGPVLAQAA